MTAFVMQMLNDAQEKDWELDIFIPTELLNKVMMWLCEQQSTDGAFIEHSPIYDRKMRVGVTMGRASVNMCDMKGIDVTHHDT